MTEVSAHARPRGRTRRRELLLDARNVPGRTEMGGGGLVLDAFRLPIE